MKRFVIAVSMILVVVAASVSVNIAFERKIGQLISGLTDLFEAANTVDDEALLEATKDYNRLWEKNSVFIHTIIIHRGMDEAEQRVTGLEMHLKAGNRDEYKTACIEAINELKSIGRAEKLLPENILNFSGFIHK